MVGAVVALVVAVAVWLTLSHIGSPVAAEEAANVTNRTVAVMPFTIRGGHLSYLREGMVDLLSMGLDGASGISVIEPIALLDVVRRDSSAAGDLPRARLAARHFHAGRFAIGTVVDAAGHLTVRVDLYATENENAKPLAVATAAGTEGQVALLVDTLTRQLVAAMLDGREPRLTQLATRTTTSLPALKSYLRGSQAMRATEYGDATQAFRSAIEADSTFALAYYGLSMAIGWATEGSDRAASIMAQQAVRHSRGLSPHDSLLLVAHRDAWDGETLKGEAEYRRLLTNYPDDAEAWHELGEVIFHGGAMSGHAMRDARDAFTKASSVDAFRPSAMAHLARIAAVTFDTAAVDSLARSVQRMGLRGPRAVEIMTIRTFVSGGSAERAQAVAAAANRDDRDVWILARDVAAYTGAWPDAEAVALHLTAVTHLPGTRAAGWATIARIRGAAGRPAAAREALALCAALDPQLATQVGGYLASLPFLPAGSADLAMARNGLSRSFAPVSRDARTSEFDLGERDPRSRRMLTAAIDIRERGSTTFTMRADTGARLWTEAIEVAKSGGRRAGDAGDLRLIARQRSDSMNARWGLYQSTLPRSLEHVVRFGRARLLHAAGNYEEARRWFGSFPAYGQDDAVYRAVAARGSATAEEALGHAAQAARAYEEAAWLWRFAEPSVLPEVSTLRQRANRLRHSQRSAN